MTPQTYNLHRILNDRKEMHILHFIYTQLDVNNLHTDCRTGHNYPIQGFVTIKQNKGWSLTGTSGVIFNLYA